MESRSNEDIERMIVRQLDGELTEDEQLELNRELIRDPEANSMMADYRKVDELAAAAIERALGDDRSTFDPAALPDPGASAAPRRYHRGWWMVPGSIAAALLAVVVARFPLQPSFNDSLADANNSPHKTAPVLPRIGGGSHVDGIMRNVGDSPVPRRVNRSTGREIIGVMGDDGNVYWIEVERVKTVTRPRPGSVVEF
jgi:hypothetical protein